MKLTYFASELDISAVEVGYNGRRIFIYDSNGRNLQLERDNDAVWVEWVVSLIDRTGYRIHLNPGDWDSFYKAAVDMAAEFARTKFKKLERRRVQQREATSVLRASLHKFKRQLGGA